MPDAQGGRGGRVVARAGACVRACAWACVRGCACARALGCWCVCVCAGVWAFPARGQAGVCVCARGLLQAVALPVSRLALPTPGSRPHHAKQAGAGCTFARSPYHRVENKGKGAQNANFHLQKAKKQSSRWSRRQAGGKAAVLSWAAGILGGRAGCSGQVAARGSGQATGRPGKAAAG